MTDWERLVREHGPAVFAIAWRILGHAADTEDVVQEVFLQAYQVRRQTPVRSWGGLLRRLAACRALDRLRQRRGHRSLDGLALYAPEPEPVEELLRTELADRLRQAVSQLPTREAEVFCLRYFDELSNDQIADALRLRPNAVAVALHRARARLEVLLGEPVAGGIP